MVIKIGLRIILRNVLLPASVCFAGLTPSESVDALVAEILQYHLTELTSLDLSAKYLTENEASQIIQAVVLQKAPLKTLNLVRMN